MEPEIKPKESPASIAHSIREEGHGRDAKGPKEIPLAGWKDIAFRVKDQIIDDNVSFVAAGIAFYFLLAMIPTMGAVVGVYGLVANPGDVEDQLMGLYGVIPNEALDLVSNELTRLTSNNTAASLAAFIGLLVALWGGSKAMDALITGMNIAYNEKERRNFLVRRLLAIVFTVGSVIFGLIAIALLVVAPLILNLVGLGDDFAGKLISIGRWPLMFCAAVIWLGLIYRYAPSRKAAKWRWITWGSFLAALVWIVASVGFTFYASNFGNFSKSYGSLGALVLLLMWFYISGFAVMLGAEVNCEMERQTAEDSTKHPPKPLGQRGAYAADTLGESS